MSRAILSDQDYGNLARILNLPDPTAPQHAATKAYVDSVVEGLAWKDNVRVASVATINLAAPGATVNGVNMVLNDRFLAKDQSTNTDNGIYIWNGASTPATRSADTNTFDELESAVVSVDEGTSAGSTYRQTGINGTIGVTPVSWTSFGTAAAAATETIAGIIMIATQAKTDAGTDDISAITPLKLANWSGRKRKVIAAIGDGSAVSFNIDHGFNTRGVVVEVYRNSGSFDTVLADVARPTADRVTIGFAAAPAATAYSVVIIG